MLAVLFFSFLYLFFIKLRKLPSISTVLRVFIRNEWCVSVNCFRYIFVHVCVLNYVWFFGTLWTLALQASVSMGFSRQEYWSGIYTLICICLFLFFKLLYVLDYKSWSSNIEITLYSWNNLLGCGCFLFTLLNLNY